MQLSLEPLHVFPEVESRRTQIRDRDLNPLFDETFELYAPPLSSGHVTHGMRVKLALSLSLPPFPSLSPSLSPETL